MANMYVLAVINNYGMAHLSESVKQTNILNVPIHPFIIHLVGHTRGASIGLQGNLSTSFVHFGTHAILNKGYLSTHVLFLHIFGRRHSAIVYF